MSAIYLDSTAFIWPALYEDKKAMAARDLIKNIREGRQNAATSVLTFDEVVWKIKKERTLDAALMAGNAILQMSGLSLIEVNHETLLKAYELIELYKLHPRDAIHAACAINRNIMIIISEDKDFDKIKELKRKSLSEL